MYQRFAIYAVPDGDWGDFGASWLGWDNRTGQDVAQSDPDQIALTARPRKYGFHGTIKPPFRLADGQTQDALQAATESLCGELNACALPSLQLSQLGSFFALTAPADHVALRQIADPVVRGLEPFRAALSEQDLARRRASRLTPAQDALLIRWGYPYVFDEFRFHLTLTGPCDDPDAAETRLRAELADLITQPLTLDSLCLLGEAADGRFHVLKRFALAG